MTNQGSLTLTEGALELQLTDAQGRQVMGYPLTLDGFNLEAFGGSHYAPFIFSQSGLAAGMNANHTIPLGPEYDLATGVRAAITYYKTDQGNGVYLAEASLEWLGSDGSRTPPAEPGKFMGSLGSTPERAAQNVSLGIGFSAHVLYGQLAQQYGFSQGGLWLMEVQGGSLGQRAGLKAGDLLVAVNGIRIVDDALAIERGKAELWLGQEVSFTYEREGELITTAITKD